ncbi:MAG: hypothetical protein Q8R47_00260 [Nanoarchaeota archaeon]|nr:hypothetical protein [Nanoarchaeota archaeon]
MKKLICDYSNLASFTLRVALAVPFLFVAIDATLQPEAWVGFIPFFVREILPASLVLGAHALVDFTLALWLLSGWKTTYAAAFSALNLATIIIVNLAALDIIFRDVGLLLAAVALGVLQYKK